MRSTRLYDEMRRFSSSDDLPAVVVAIPAHNEEDVIAACLRSIAAQTWHKPVGVVCLVNNSSDDTFEAACREAARTTLAIRVVDVTMAAASSNAGGARRAAMDLAADWLDEGEHANGVVLTTDADSEPAPDWIAKVRAAIRQGADAVAGTIGLYAQDAAALPAHIHARGALESRYDKLLTEVFARLDPRPHDPWPRHATEAGANLAVTLRAYRAIGGLPEQPCGEDKALVARLDHRGFRVRHAPDVHVSTSGRLDGRARGGVADTIRLRCAEPEAFCDEYLEPALNARFRGAWRGRLRAAFASDGASVAARTFGETGELAAEAQTFGAFWEALEKNDPRLRRGLLRPSDLPREIDAAEVLLRHLRRRALVSPDTSRAGNPLFVPAE